MIRITYKSVKDAGDVDRYPTHKPRGVRVSDTFGSGCVRPVVKENQMDVGQKTSQAGDGMCWVLSDPFEWPEIEVGPSADDQNEDEKRTSQIPWASNFLRALNLLRMDALKKGRSR